MFMHRVYMTNDVELQSLGGDCRTGWKFIPGRNCSQTITSVQGNRLINFYGIYFSSMYMWVGGLLPLKFYARGLSPLTFPVILIKNTVILTQLCNMVMQQKKIIICCLWVCRISLTFEQSGGL